MPPDTLLELEGHLGHHFRDEKLLILALKHRSYVYAQQGKGVESNERLEFLGDSVLNIVAAKYLFERYPTRNEGFMTRLRTKLVNGDILGSEYCNSRKLDE